MDGGGAGRDGAEEFGELVDGKVWPDGAVEEHVVSEGNVGDDGDVVKTGEVPGDGGVGVGGDGLAAGREPLVAATVDGDDVAVF